MKKFINLKSNIKNRSQCLNYQFWLWLGTFFVTLLVFVIISTAWLVRHALLSGPRLTENQSNAVLSIAEFPGLAKLAIQQVVMKIDGNPTPLLMDRKEVEKPSWVRRFPAIEDKGYLLFSGVDYKERQSVVKLIRIADGAELAIWKPNFLNINNQITDKKSISKGSWMNLRAVHPLLLDDGDIIFNTGNSLVRQSVISSNPLWVLNQVMHHSNELDVIGGTMWVPSVSLDGFTKNPYLQNHIRDDALAHVSIEGRLLERRSFSRILLDNGLGSLLMGTSGLSTNNDPIHMNQIKVAQTDSRYWKRGDLLISARNLSTLFLYRPSTNKILWHQIGPWMNQHSVDFVDSHRISVFSNNVVSGVPNKAKSFLTPNDINRVYVFDFDNNQSSQPYEKLLAVARPITLTEGRAQILSDGGLFVEETNYGRLLRFTKTGLLWSKVNDYDDKRVGALSWSRYLTANQVSGPLKAIAAKQSQIAK
jgi:hypothetical protein